MYCCLFVLLVLSLFILVSLSHFRSLLYSPTSQTSSLSFSVLSPYYFLLSFSPVLTVSRPVHLSIFKKSLPLSQLYSLLHFPSMFRLYLYDPLFFHQNIGDKK
uniref:Secreted protein n=1 Tax=Cacopsylla melanoneura TaxID=428564 RepID=A0A8D9F2U3_9HEMI